MSHLPWIVACICVVAGCAGPAGGKPGTGSVAGTVADAKGEPVRGVTVNVLSAEEKPQVIASGASNPRGEFQIDDVPPGAGLTVAAGKRWDTRGVSGTKEGVAVRAGSLTEVGEIRLRAR